MVFGIAITVTRCGGRCGCTVSRAAHIGRGSVGRTARGVGSGVGSSSGKGRVGLAGQLFGYSHKTPEETHSVGRSGVCRSSGSGRVGSGSDPSHGSDSSVVCSCSGSGGDSSSRSLPSEETCEFLHSTHTCGIGDACRGRGSGSCVRPGSSLPAAIATIPAIPPVATVTIAVMVSP